MGRISTSFIKKKWSIKALEGIANFEGLSCFKDKFEDLLFPLEVESNSLEILKIFNKDCVDLSKTSNTVGLVIELFMP